MNNTSNVMEQTYNLTAIFGNSLMDDPISWYASFNSQLMGVPSLIIVVVFALVLFFLAKQIPDTSHTKAGLYTGYTMSLIVGIAFAATASDGTKIITWLQYAPILFVTAILIMWEYANRKF